MRAEFFAARDLAATGAVLIGLYFVLSGVAGSVYVLALSAPAEAGSSGPGFAGALPWLGGSVVPGVLLITARRRIAAFVGPPVGAAGSSSRTALLSVGVVLFGVFVALQGLAQAGQSLAVLLMLPADLSEVFAAHEHRAIIGTGATKLAVGVLLAIRPAVLVRYL